MYIILYTLNNEYCGFIHSVGISFCGCIIIQSQGYITRGKSSHWNNKLTDIVDIWRLTEQQTESLQKLVFNEYWWNLTICTNWQNIFKYIFSNKFNYTEVKAVFPFLHNRLEWLVTDLCYPLGPTGWHQNNRAESSADTATPAPDSRQHSLSCLPLGAESASGCQLYPGAAGWPDRTGSRPG